MGNTNGSEHASASIIKQIVALEKNILAEEAVCRVLMRLSEDQDLYHNASINEEGKKCVSKYNADVEEFGRLIADLALLFDKANNTDESQDIPDLSNLGEIMVSVQTSRERMVELLGTE
jgi:hypothetical protein